MSERTDFTPAPETGTPPSEPAAPQASPPPAAEALTQGVHALPAADVHEDSARTRIASLEREAKALGADPSSALIFHEIGLLWEDPLKNPRNAAVAYQNAYRIAPRFVANLRSARRLFTDVGNWQMALQLLDAELAGVDDARTQAGLLYEKAVMLEERLARAEEATACFSRALALDAKDLTLLVQLEGVFAARQDYASLVEVYRQLSAALEEAPLKAHYLTQAAQILETRLQQPQEAAQAYRAAFALDRKDALRIAAIKRLAERGNDPEELLAALLAEAELTGAGSGPTSLEIAKIYERLGRREDALSALLAARRANPNDPLVLSALATRYEADERYEDLADVLMTWLGSINDEAELVAINLRLGELYEERLKRPDDAIGRYRAILAKIPGHAQALASLGKLYFKKQDWSELIAVFEAEAAAGEDARQKAAKIYKAAEILEERLRREEDAIARYNECLQLQPGYLPAQKALTRLYERQGRWADLATMHEQDLLQIVDRDQMIATLNKMAAIYEERLHDLDHAVDCLKRILEIAPDHLPTLRSLARLYQASGRWTDLLHNNELEASLVGDTKQVISIHHRGAEILEEQLQDRAGAIGAYERVLALSPAYLPALKALGRLYAQDGRWEDLIRMYRAEAEISPSPEHAAGLTAKIGELYEQKLEDLNEAIASYQEVLTLAPSYFPALRALARIYRGQEAWESLIEVLRSEAAIRTDPLERANALFQASAIWEDRMDRADLAIEGYQEVLRLIPGHAAALYALERLHTAQGDVKALIGVLDRQTQTGEPPARITAYLKLAQLYLDTQGEPSRAAQCAEAILALDPGHLLALRVLERARASDRVRRSEVRAKLAERVADPHLKGAFRLAAALDPEAPLETRLPALKRALAADPEDRRMAFKLERALRQAGDAPGLITYFQDHLAAAGTAEQKLELSMRIAEIAELKLDDLHLALRHYRIAAELSPTFLPAIQGTRRMHQLLGDTRAARAALEAEGELARDPRTAIDAWVAAGKLCVDPLGDLDGAVACFRKALERNPLDPAASAALEDLLAQRGGAEDLANLHERRGEAKLAQKDGAAAAAELFTAARITLESLDARARAVELLERALEANPQHPEALSLRGELALEQKQYAEAAAAFSRRVQQGGEAKEISALHLQLGALYQDHLGDSSRAAAHLQTTLAGDPRNLDALERLAALHTRSRNWSGAADCLRRLLELEPRPDRLAEHSVALAQILDQGFGDTAQAAQLYRKALELAPSHLGIVERLVVLYEKLGQLPELTEMLEQQAQRAQDEHDVPKALAMRLRLGGLYAGALDAPEKAIASYRIAVELAPDSVAARAPLAELLTRDSTSVNAAIEEHRALLRLEPSRTESLHALFKLYEASRQVDRAFCVACVLSFLRAANDTESALLSESRSKAKADPVQKLDAADLELLMHPDARNGVLEVLRAVGDEVGRVFPPSLDSLGIDKKQDRLKSDHAIHKAVRAVAQIFGVTDFDVFQAKRGQVSIELTSPPSVCVGTEVVRRYNTHEQRFLFGRAALGLANHTAAVAKLSTGELGDLIGNSVRIHVPGFTLLGRKNDDATKQLRKAYPRKTLKALEGPATTFGAQTKIDLPRTVEALAFSADRAGALLCADVGVALNVLLKDDPSVSTHVRPDAGDPIVQAVRQRSDLRALIQFAISDELFKLRQKIGVAI